MPVDSVSLVLSPSKDEQNARGSTSSPRAISTAASARLIVADRGDAGLRIDLVLRRHLRDVAGATRTRLQTWIESGQVTSNGRQIRRAAARAALGDRILIALPAVTARRRMTAERMALAVLYEDESLLAIDKPAGMVVHPAYKNASGTAMNALLWRARDWPPEMRPSIVGRLDKLTSGVVIVAKTAATHAALQRALMANDAEKAYLAIVYGRVNVARGRIDLPLAKDRRSRRTIVTSPEAGAASVTRFERLARVPAPRAGLSLLRCSLQTGRAHQIRVHLAARGWPIVGDPVYGEPRWNQIVDAELAQALRAFPRQALHAVRVAFIHPATQERLVVEAPLPTDFEKLLSATGLTIS
jgi:23S rRNA pseudouridine1911/1915/1917 synthase